jgi:hypothetical protein
MHKYNGRHHYHERHIADNDRSPLDKDARDPAIRLIYAEALTL